MNTSKTSIIIYLLNLWYQQCFIYKNSIMIKNNKVPTLINLPGSKRIDNYVFKFTDLLGEGNFSKVYKAYDEVKKEEVAIKIIKLNSLKSQKLEQLLFSEIDVLKKLTHPNILQCYNVFTSYRNCYIVTEICNGGDLQKKLRKQHYLTEKSAEPIISDIFSGLVYLASKNIIHRDLKAANVFLHDGRAKIADFGFAKFAKETFKDMNIGSPIYMSPQGLIRNIYGPKTDVWAFGILIFELLHGQNPFYKCHSENELRYMITKPISMGRFRSQISQQLKDIMKMCLEVDEKKRASIQKLRSHPYFRQLMKRPTQRRLNSPSIESKYSTTSEAGNKRKQSKKNLDCPDFLELRRQQTATSQKKISSQDGSRRYSQRLFSVRHNWGENRHRRNYSTSKNLQQKRAKKNEMSLDLKNRSTNSLSPKGSLNQSVGPKVSKIFSSMITYKTCVNILHYCRLNYKFVVSMQQASSKQKSTIIFFSEWVMTLMDQIKLKINSNGIIYDQENAWLREKKLREVINQYIKKYRSELGADRNPTLTAEVVENYAHSEYQKIDANIHINKAEAINLILGHYIIMIIEGASILKKCYQEQCYSLMEKYNEIQRFLATKKSKMDLQSYRLIRRKVTFL